MTQLRCPVEWLSGSHAGVRDQSRNWAPAESPSKVHSWPSRSNSEAVCVFEGPMPLQGKMPACPALSPPLRHRLGMGWKEVSQQPSQEPEQGLNWGQGRWFPKPVPSAANPLHAPPGPRTASRGQTATALAPRSSTAMDGAGSSVPACRALGDQGGHIQMGSWTPFGLSCAGQRGFPSHSEDWRLTLPAITSSCLGRDPSTQPPAPAPRLVSGRAASSSLGHPWRSRTEPEKAWGSASSHGGSCGRQTLARETDGELSLRRVRFGEWGGASMGHMGHLLIRHGDPGRSPHHRPPEQLFPQGEIISVVWSSGGIPGDLQGLL
uniref:Uncharacterized protein n=1 Tax=Sphaerodactylus townsendi TaxID=933632 RepID=A0ACB8FLN4_9SAUR